MTAAWYADHKNLAALAHYMWDIGDDLDRVIYMLEKPWKFEDDWKDAQEWWLQRA